MIKKRVTAIALAVMILLTGAGAAAAEGADEIRACGWIAAPDMGDVCPVFRKSFSAEKEAESAELQITSLGVYEATLNGKRIGDFVMAPGWTTYSRRLQVQTYDVTELLEGQNELRVTVGKGWFRSPMPAGIGEARRKELQALPCGLIALLKIRYRDGSEDRIATDESWEAGESPVRFSEIYDGERYDAQFETTAWQPVKALEWSKDILILQEGETVKETGRIPARKVFKTPAGELVVDFGQEVTGYVEFTAEAKAGDVIRFDHGEMLNKKGNFYNANYRSAKAEVQYICREGQQTWHPELTFFGFRYIRLKEWPGEAKPEQFTAITVQSDLKRTGWLESGHELLNRLFSNIIWSQRGNFLDVPTDCPQRDERMGWTGDAQVFAKTATYLFDTERFFRKWLRDMSAEQREDGGIPHVVPDIIRDGASSAGWADGATIIPWQVYQTYGDAAVLEEQFNCMKRWVDYVTQHTKTPGLWIGGGHYGDWLGLDAPSGSYKGSSRDDLIASAFYAHSTELLIKAGKVLGQDVSAYETLHGQIVEAFRNAYPTYKTQTEYAVAIQFGLAEDPQKEADKLAKKITDGGKKLQTGFIGTPYILHVLSRYGHADLAWDLLLRKKYPGWLYPVTKGATTIWEHWDGIKSNGGFWAPEMNSFNHYAYGSVADWVFEQAAGIRHDDEHPGFSEIIWEPHPDKQAGWLTATLETRSGTVRASWRYDGDQIRYELETPVKTEVRLPGQTTVLTEPGIYVFWGK